MRSAAIPSAIERVGDRLGALQAEGDRVGLGARPGSRCDRSASTPIVREAAQRVGELGDLRARASASRVTLSAMNRMTVPLITAASSGVGPGLLERRESAGSAPSASATAAATAVRVDGRCRSASRRPRRG